MEFDLDHTVKYKLTKYGKAKLKEHNAYRKRMFRDRQHIDPKETELSLWLFMQVFGPYLSWSGEDVVEGNKIEILKKKQY